MTTYYLLLTTYYFGNFRFRYLPLHTSYLLLTAYYSLKYRFRYLLLTAYLGDSVVRIFSGSMQWGLGICSASMHYAVGKCSHTTYCLLLTVYYFQNCRIRYLKLTAHYLLLTAY